MTLDVVLFRPEGNQDLVKESQRRRFKPESTVQDVIDADQKWKAGNRCRIPWSY